MSYISKTGIEPGSIIKSDHVLRIINALDGTDEKDISVMGTVAATYLQGDASGLTAVTASIATTSSYAAVATSASYARTATSASYSLVATSASYAFTATTASYSLVATSASYALTSTTASHALAANTASYAFQLVEPPYATTGSNTFIGDQTITGSVSISDTLTVTGSIISSGDLYLRDRKQFNYGAFSSIVNQSGSANTSASFQFNIIDRNSGVDIHLNEHFLPTRIVVDNTGVYNLQFSAQIAQTAGSAEVHIWFKKNGSNVANSGTVLTLASNTKTVAAWNFIDRLNAGEYLEIAYQSTSNNTTYPYFEESGNIPLVPAVIATLTQVS